LLLATSARTAFSQSYGPNDQVLVVGAAAFQRSQAASDNHEFFTDGYFGGGGFYYAPVSLPDGAEVTKLCFSGYGTGYGSGPFALERVNLPAGGQSPGVVIINNTYTDFIIGYVVVCSDPFSYTIHSTDAGINLAHRLQVGLGGDMRLGGVQIFWRRQGSPAPATPSFNDVPADHQFFQFIEALRASGITDGCQASPPLFCPGDPLTRGQMAKFLARALGLHWAN